MLFDGVTLSIQVAFENASLGGSVWTDITSYARSCSIRRGRQRELERPEPGTLVLELADTDRRFDPYNASSPYSPYVLPMRPIRVRATYASVTYDLFRGFTDAWWVNWVRPNFSVVTVTATDIFKVLANRTLEDAYYYETFNDLPDFYLRLDEQAGAEISDEIAKTKGTLVGTLTSTEALTVGAENRALDFASTYAAFPNQSVNSASMTVEAWVKFDALPSISQGLADIVRQGGTFPFILSVNDFGNPFFLPYWGTAYAYSTAALEVGETYHLVGTYADGVAKLFINGVDTATSAAITSLTDATIGLWIGGDRKRARYVDGTIDEVAIYPFVLGSSRITAHYNAGTAPWNGDSTGLRIARCLIYLGISGDIDTGNTTLGNASHGGTNALDHLIALTATENGNLWVKGDGNVNFRERHAIYTEARYSTVQKTFGASTGEIDFESVTLAPADDLIRNDVRVTRRGGATQRAENTDSITAYLRRTFEISDLLLNTDAESLAFAEFLVDRYADALNRIESVTINPRSNAASAFPAVLGLDLDDRIKVIVRPTTGAAIEQESHLETIEHTITPDSWRTTYQLSPAQITPPLILDSSTLGLLDTARVGY